MTKSELPSKCVQFTRQGCVAPAVADFFVADRGRGPAQKVQPAAEAPARGGRWHARYARAIASGRKIRCAVTQERLRWRSRRQRRLILRPTFVRRRFSRCRMFFSTRRGGGPRHVSRDDVAPLTDQRHGNSRVVLLACRLRFAVFALADWTKETRWNLS
jgi:hypothetical protein